MALAPQPLTARFSHAALAPAYDVVLGAYADIDRLIFLVDTNDVIPGEGLNAFLCTMCTCRDKNVLDHTAARLMRSIVAQPWIKRWRICLSWQKRSLQLHPNVTYFEANYRTGDEFTVVVRVAVRERGQSG